MVADTGAPPCPGGIRPLDAPQLVQVEVGDNDMPAAIGTARNRNAGALVHRGSTSSGHPSTGSGRTGAVPVRGEPVEPAGELVEGPPHFDSNQTERLRPGPSKGRWCKILEVLDTWRIEDEWWRKQPISRLYYRVVLEDGTMTGLFKDLVSGDWYSQRG